MRPTNKGASPGDLTHATLAIGIAFVLVFSAISTIATIALPTAFAEKGGSGSGKGNSSSDHGKNDKSKDQQESNQTSTNSTSSTESEAEDDGTSKKGKGKESHQSIKPSWVEQLNQTADEIHAKHLKMNAGFTGAYTANLTYTLNANGTADAIGNSTYTGDAQLSLNMSVWKSTPGQVKMDVTGGSLLVDGQSMEVHSGYSHYRTNNHRLLIVAFMMDGGYSEDEDTYLGASNQTSTDNTTKSEDQEGLSEPQVRVLKLWITIPQEAAGLPTSESPDPVEIELMSPQSKLASMWFMEMDGEVALSS